MPCSPAPRPRRLPGRAAVLAAALVWLTPVAGAAAAAPTPTAALPPPPGCATAVAVVRGTATSTPTPLPHPVSAVGGALLSAPGVQVNLPAGTPAPPALRATAWMVADLGTGTVIAACNAHVPLAPASTLKVLTALTLAHRLDWNARYVAQPADAATDGSKVGLVPGSDYTVGELFHGLMLSSGNDAATALARVGGGMAATTTLMNERASALGAFDTHAVNDSGLDAAGQVSSAYDLALLGRALLGDPQLAQLVRTTTYTFPGKSAGAGTGKARTTYQIQNHNGLLTSYPGTTGVKDGYTVAAGGSYIASATRNGHTYVVTLLRGEGYPSRTARQLLDWAFAAGPVARTVGVLVAPGQATAADAAGVSDTATAPTASPTAPPGVAAASGTAPAPAGGPGSSAVWLAAGAALAVTAGAIAATTARLRRRRRGPGAGEDPRAKDRSPEGGDPSAEDTGQA